MCASGRTIWAENSNLTGNGSYVVAVVMSASVRATCWKLEQGNNVRNLSKLSISRDLKSESQRSYITNCLKDELSLLAECQETMLIETSGSQDEKLQTCDALCFGVKLPDGTDMKMSPYSVPLICEPLTGRSVVLARSMYKHVNGIHLADYSTGAEPAEVDIPIGSDQ